MVGRKFFMALLNEFQELCRILSCQTVPQPSPTHVYKPRARNSRPSQRVLRSLSTISEEVSYDEMGNKTDKLSEVRQDHVLKILSEERVPLKESNFSPYTPLPAIGTASDPQEAKPKAKMVRQETYRVLNPVFVKGPLDLHKFPPLKNVNGVAKQEGLERNGFKFSNQRHKIKPTEKSGTKNDSYRWLDPSKSFLSRNESKDLKTQDGTASKNKENTTAFWIDF